jgi:uncharacterized coiled-coil protein SlyX
MSPIAKLFTIINVVLAGLFLGWAVRSLSTTSDFKTRLDKALADNQALQATCDQAKSSHLSEKQQLEAGQAAVRNERDSALADVERLQGRVADEERKNNEMRASVDTISKSIENQVQQSKQNAEARDRAMQAQREAEKAKDDAVAAQAAAEAKAGELETSLHTAEGTIADLEKTSTGLKKEVDSLNTQLTSLADYTGAKLGDFTPMPMIEGKVLDVALNVQPGLIAINKGTADNVKRGYTFEIYDGKTYKGQVRVEYVHPNVCSALIIRTVDGQKIRQGDSASTRL